MDTLKNCTTCHKQAGKKSLDDVHPDCYQCVWAEGKLGYYPYWVQADEQLAEAGWQGKEYTYMTPDNVNSPQHYTTGGIETIDFILAKLGPEGTIAYCMGNVIKYVTRWKDKGGLEDLKKAQWYLNYAINLKAA